MTTTRHVLMSVADKEGLLPLADAFVRAGFGLIASGGTAKVLREGGLEVTAVETLTAFPEMLGGRVKTLHPAIAGGILARRYTDDMAALAEHGFRSIDAVVVDLYPFAEALAGGEPDERLIEEIDIGGVTLLRAAAKNAADVLVVPGLRHYDAVIRALDEELPLLGWDELAPLRRRLAAAAFRLTSDYDALIAGWLGDDDGGAQHTTPDDVAMLADLSAMSPATALRYGENPHQRAGFLAPNGDLPWVQHGGKELSYNNILDLDAAWQAVLEFDGPAAVIVKHGSPCGIAAGSATDEAAGAVGIEAVLAAALAADPVSAFGGIIALNRPVDANFSEVLGDLFVECLAVPFVAPDVTAALMAKRRNLRIVTLAAEQAPQVRFRSAAGGLLWQEADHAGAEDAGMSQHFAALPAELREAAAFAWRAVKHVKSNAIVLAGLRDGVLVTAGIGGGQTNRVDAVAQALGRARRFVGDDLSGLVLASDAFFPFPDSIALAAEARVGAIVQPGGAMRDEAVIEAARDAGIPMVMTGRRHFRH
jgi:phosphoribosylaminoimidazolecarboxamide formyltransferase/IMP cyclohydrolase